LKPTYGSYRRIRFALNASQNLERERFRWVDVHSSKRGALAEQIQEPNDEEFRVVKLLAGLGWRCHGLILSRRAAG
jgi:hypothetical protein